MHRYIFGDNDRTTLNLQLKLPKDYCQKIELAIFFKTLLILNTFLLKFELNKTDFFSLLINNGFEDLLGHFLVVSEVAKMFILKIEKISFC